MNNVNLHKQRIAVLVIAFIAFISMFLTWITEADAESFGRKSSNAFNGISFIIILPIIATIGLCFMGNKLEKFTALNKKIILFSFGLMVLLDIIFLISISSKNKVMEASTGFGLWFNLVVALAGLAIVSGVTNKLTTYTSTQSSATPPPPSPPASK